MSNNNPTLPSAESANDLIDGKPGAAGRVLMHALSRAAIIYLGMQAGRLIKVDPPKNAAALSVLGALAIELFVLSYIKMEKEKRKDENGDSNQWSI